MVSAWRTGILLAGVVLSATPVFASEPAPLAIAWQSGATPHAVDVRGLAAPDLRALERETWTAERWAMLFSVLVEPVATEAVPPMAGAWRVQGDVLRFEPRFPLVRGVRYRAEFRPAQLPAGAGGRAAIVSYFQLPLDTSGPATEVAQIYPSVDTLPENQLKFYVQFSAPMSRGSIYEHIHVRDAAGQEADLPFLDIDEELWDPGMTRLTLLIDPGRIKRGVKPLEDLGPVFEAGKAYTLVIDPAWRDATGRPLRGEYRKTFRVGPPDRTPPDPARWTLQLPAAGTRAPLVVGFDESMDWALALRLIAVADTRDAALAGAVALTDRERRWSFTPAEPWRAGTHRLVVAATIEDLAGNNIGKAFDVDLFEGVDRQLATSTVKRAFEIK